MKYAIINESSVVQNIAVSDSALSENWIEITSPCSIGDIYGDGIFNATIKSLESIQAEKLDELSAYYKEIKENPTCDTGLGFRVDSGYDNKTDFESVYGLITEYASDPDEFRSSQSVDAIAIVDRLVSGNPDDGYTVSIRDADNQYQSVTIDQMLGVINSIRDFGFRLKPAKWAMEELINNATIDTIHDINPTDGWP